MSEKMDSNPSSDQFRITNYEELIAKYQDPELLTLLILMSDKDFSSRLQFSDCRDRFRRLLSQLEAKTTNPVILTGITYLLKMKDDQLPVCGNASEFKKIIGK